MVGVSAPSPVAFRLSPAPLSKPTSFLYIFSIAHPVRMSILFLNFFYDFFLPVYREPAESACFFAELSPCGAQ